MVVKRKRWMPYFMQTSERKEREKEIVKRAIRIACNKADYCYNICSYANIWIDYLNLGGNPRGIIKAIPKRIEESIRFPRGKPTMFGEPYFKYHNLTKEKRAEFLEKKLAGMVS